jgi:hypothetical protein
MTKTRNKFNKKNKSVKSIKSSGGTDLNQKYSLASIDENSELGGFKHSNTMLAVLGVGSLLYYVYYKQNIHT